MASNNAATGGMLVILGILVALAIGFMAYRSGFLGDSSPSIKVELPNVDVK